MATFWYNSGKANLHQQRALLYGLKWLGRRFHQYIAVMERVEFHMAQPEIVEAVLQAVLDLGQHPTATLAAAQVKVDEQSLRNSGRRIRRNDHIHALTGLVRTKLPKEVRDEELATLRTIFQDLLLANAFALESARKQGVTDLRDLRADQHFYTNALAALIETREVLLLSGLAYPFSVLNAR